MQPIAPHVAISSGRISWMLIILFFAAAFFIVMVCFRRVPSVKSIAIGSLIAAFLAVPLVFIGVILLFFGWKVASVPQNVVIRHGTAFAHGMHEHEEESAQIDFSAPLEVPPSVIAPQRPSVKVEKTGSQPTPSAVLSNQDAEVVAEVASADEAKQAEKPVEAESTTASKSVVASATSSNPRPTWVDAPPKRVGGIYRTKVTVGPFATREECDRALNAELLKATNNYIDSFLGEGACHWVHLPPGYLSSSRIYRDQWQEEILASFGPMIQVHTLLEFDENTRHDLQQRWRAGRAEGRLGLAGLGAGLVLALLGTIFGYLKIDTATRGYYTRRLQFLAAAAILTTLAAGLFLARG